MNAARGALGRELAERRLRASIARGDMAPGQRLVESEMAALYGVTRNAIRAALDGLIAEGLVERVPNSGARVRTVSTAEAVEITECRMVLEALLARKAAERATDWEIERLRRQLDGMRAAVAAGEPLKHSALIAETYDLLRLAARQPTAATLVERLRAQLVRHQFRLSLRPGRPQRSLADFELIVEAVADRDPDRAEAAMRRHLQRVATALTETTGEA